MKSTLFLAAASATLVSGVAAAVIAVPPSKVLQARATTICGQWDSVETGTYTVYQDLWNKDNGTGSQCSTIGALNGSTLSWSTSWSWAGNATQVKSYANVVAALAIKKLSAISSIPTTWDWR